MKTIKEKYQKLQEILSELGEVIIAFSGGIDSTFLTKVTYDLLQEKASAITIASPQLPKEELLESRELAKIIGIKHFIIDEGINSSWFENNPPDRCYICKNETLHLIKKYCSENNLTGQIIEGSNFDDLDDFRPGFKAVKEHKVRSPLLEAELTKDEIRQLSKELGLPCWDKPASPCLATRFLFGEKITPEKLQMVYKAEKYLRELGIKQVRVRIHQNIARIETQEKYFIIIIKSADSIANKLKTLGLEFVTLDLSGYKRGSMNREN